MKVCELYDHVAQLGFEDTMLEYDKHFVLTANRSLYEVASLRPQTGSILIHHEPMENMITNFSFAPQKKTDDIVFMEDGAKAFYFEACGLGTCHVEKYNESTGTFTDCFAPIAINSKGHYTAYRGFIKYDNNFVEGEVRLRFTGNYVYYIRNVALYEYILSDEVNDIPAFEPYTKYDVSAMCSDFLTFCRPPIEDDEEHKFLSGVDYDLENDRVILLPYDKPGVYKVRYNRKPLPIANDGDPANNESVIDLDEDLCQLLPLRIAAFVWADDEDAKAQYYLAQYNAQAALIMAQTRNAAPVQYRNTYGW